MKYLILGAVFLNITLGACSAQPQIIEEALLDEIERGAFDYFIAYTNRENGFTRNSTERNAPASVTASGFLLAAIPIGIERGWLDKEQGYSLAETILRTFKDKIYNKDGFFYHFISIDSSERVWQSEVSMIDSAIFFAGALAAGEYFKGTDVERLAREIYKRADWKSFSARDGLLWWEWTPEKGYRSKASSFSEAILAYFLAIGSPTYPLEPSSWDRFARPIAKLNGTEMVYCESGSLFTYTLPCAFLDFRNKHDRYLDYWTNARRAVVANRAYCITNKEDLWGVSASLGPDGYKNYGACPGFGYDDGTIAPYAIVSSLPLEPELAMKALNNIYTNYKNKIWGKYGFTDAFNLSRNWHTRECLAIDKGLELLAVENYRTGLIWKLLGGNEYVKEAFRKIGFEEGAQMEVNFPKARFGNPDARMTIARKKRKNPQPIILTTEDNRNVEVGLGLFDDDRDASAAFYVSYDDENFYVEGRITDDDIWAQKSAGDIYRNDCVEIFFDTDKNGFVFKNDPRDFQFGFSPGQDGKSRAWAWGPIRSKPKYVGYSVKRTENGFILRAKIPFKEMKGFKPNSGDEIRFSIAYHDRDSDGTEGKLNWSIDKDPSIGKILFGIAKFE